MKRSSYRKTFSVSHPSKQVIDEVIIGQRDGPGRLLPEPSFSPHTKKLVTKKIMKSVINLTKPKSKRLAVPMRGPSGRNIMKIFERKTSQTKAEKLGKHSDVIGDMLEMVSRQNIDIMDLDHNMLARKISSMNVIESSSRILPRETVALKSHRSKIDRKKVGQQRKSTFKLLDFLKTGDPRDRIHRRDNPDNDQSGFSKSLEAEANFEKMRASHPRMDDETG
jgi:hypothetical protein